MTKTHFLFLVHCSGKLKNQEDIGTELFADMRDYINQKLGGEETFTINVPQSNIHPVGKICIAPMGL